MPIGPSLPPHLQRAMDASRAGDEVDDDDVGPAPPPAASVAGPSRPSPSATAGAAATGGRPSSSIGPSVPAHLLARQQPTEGDEEDEDEDALGPSLPPHLLAARRQQTAAVVAAGPQRPPMMTGPQRPPAGPAPPAAAAAGPSRPPNWQPASPPRGGAPSAGDESSDDDDVVGPMPLPPGVEYDEHASAVYEFEARQARWQKEREDALKPKQPKREEWMLKPPEHVDALANIDPTKVPRGQTAFSRTSAAPIKADDQSLWTETPAERVQRLQDEAMGKKRRKENSVNTPTLSEQEQDEARRRKKRDAELQAEIERHNKKHRSSSLLDIHGKEADKRKKGKGEEAAPVIWDRDLHMSVGGKLMDEKDRKAQILDAKGLGSRFGHAKTGAYS